MSYSLRFIRMCDAFSDRPYPATRDIQGMRAWLARLGRAVKRQINADAARLDDLRTAEEIRPADCLTGNAMIVSSAGAGGDDCLAALLGAHSATGGGFVLLDTMFDPEPTLFQWAPTVGIRIIVTTRFDRLGRTAHAVPATGQFETTVIFRPGSYHQAEAAARWLNMDDPHAADQLRSMDRGRCLIVRGAETPYGWLTRAV